MDTKNNDFENDNEDDQFELQKIDENYLFDKFEQDFDKEIDTIVEKTVTILSSECVGGGIYQISMILLLSISWAIGYYYYCY
jgi:hypothetical protein